MRCILPLYSTGDTEWRGVLEEYARGFRQRLSPYNNALIWDKGLGFEGHAAVDTSHGNRYPFAALELYRAGIVFSLEEVRGLARLLTDVIWNQSPGDPRFSNFIDGSNHRYRKADRWENGLIYAGWVTGLPIEHRRQLWRESLLSRRVLQSWL
jgi:hypothetical protein